LTATTLESAIKQFLDVTPSFTAHFPGTGSVAYNVFASRRPPGFSTPYLILDVQSSPAVLFTSSSTVQNTSIAMTAYAETRHEAETLQNLIFATFKGQTFPYQDVRVAPLFVSNRSVRDCPGLGTGGSTIQAARIDWTAREQKPR
jgi:hypothetical protein